MTEHDVDDAGVAEATPASAVPGEAVDVVDPVARTELTRIARRWSELRADAAAQAAPVLREAVVSTAALTAPDAAVPDLGVAVLPDQLAAVVWDAYAARQGDGLADRLTGLRRALP